MEDTLKLIGVLVVVGISVALVVLILNWCVADAHRRGKSGFLVFVAIC